MASVIFLNIMNEANLKKLQEVLWAFWLSEAQRRGMVEELNVFIFLFLSKSHTIINIYISDLHMYLYLGKAKGEKINVWTKYCFKITKRQKVNIYRVASPTLSLELWSLEVAIRFYMQLENKNRCYIVKVWCSTEGPKDDGFLLSRKLTEAGFDS